MFCVGAVDRFKVEPSEWTPIRAIYGLPLENRHFKNVISNEPFFIIHQLMTTKGKAIHSTILLIFFDAIILKSTCIL